MIKFINFWLKTWNYSKLINYIFIYSLSLNFKIFIKNQYKIILIYNFLYTLFQSRLDFLSQHIIYINYFHKLLIKNILPLIINILLTKNDNKINKIFFIIKIWKNKKFLLLIIDYIIINPIIIFYIMINKNLYILSSILKLLIHILYILIILKNKIYINKKTTVIIIKLNIISKIFTGNYIYANNKELYNIYNICGKLHKLKLIKEQQITGLLIWIINNMMLLLLIKLL